MSIESKRLVLNQETLRQLTESAKTDIDNKSKPPRPTDPSALLCTPNC